MLTCDRCQNEFDQLKETNIFGHVEGMPDNKIWRDKHGVRYKVMLCKTCDADILIALALWWSEPESRLDIGEWDKLGIKIEDGINRGFKREEVIALIAGGVI